MSITSKSYGQLPSGEQIALFELHNKNGCFAEITNYGGILVSLHVPDRAGRLGDVVLGKDSLDAYVQGHPCFGAICGRVAGRIGGAQFEIDGRKYALQANEDDINNLHSGPEGFHLMVWEAAVIEANGKEKLQLKLTDPDGHNGFPGNLHCVVTYALFDDNTLEIQYEATTDQSTPFNPTNHSYFNLKGSGDVLDHEVQILAEQTAAVDKNASLIGRSDPVVADYNDYRDFVRLGARSILEQGNADAHFFLSKGRTAQPELAATVREPTTGRTLEVLTTEPGVQFYAGLFLSADGPDIGKNGVVHAPHDGLCLETQDYPDSVNFPGMGGAVLHPGERFRSTTCFRFKTY
ncbi:MAG: galactose-1-epimerase [Verrucomicrobia bacterium]|jgi:aldose 1-epimerase|nr:galactose-1-epimerase [Verrucomicrobiota bacterium]